ncbi:unnamed protein product [Ceutorhynchus assimilis]|uniref:Mpv17-like protein n=1 Tax=Ceutorhynchus assimilis TaxID=467358 RepID=A0A9N9MDH2_9CUCU|nr:unnamed protein product [Ceutorhynchus assimilis]
MVIFSRFAAFVNRHPVFRGMISYGTLWPTSCLIQQTMAGKTIENYDWVQALRFSLYGGLFTAPTLYAWIRVSSKLWPVTSLKTSITKALVEQLTYGPAALICFFYGMSLLEGKSIEEAKKQTETKFYPTWKVGVCFWPILQTINFHYIPEHNRVPFVSACSLVWCCFLAYMQEMSLKRAHHMKISEQLLGSSS